MNFQQLRMVSTAVRLNFNLTAVAQSLYTTQPAVSRAIMVWEEELGVPIFRRHGKRLTGLTEEGQSLLVNIHKILSEAEAIKKMSQEWRAPDVGNLRIATTHTQARYTLPPILSRFRKLYPKVRLSVHQGTPAHNAQLLHDDEADIAIATEGLTAHPDFLVLPMVRWTHVVVSVDKHPHLCVKPKAKLNLKHLAHCPIITFDRAFAGRTRIDAAFAQANVTPNIILEAADADVIKTYVKSGMGIGILPSLAVNTHDSGDRGLQVYPVGHLFGESTTWLAIRSSRYVRRYEHDFLLLCNPDLAKPLSALHSAP